MLQQPRLGTYRLMGFSGLRVSPLALGTMTFGADWACGADEDECRRMFEAYVECGGNFIDTSNNYTNGSSERLIGKFAAGRRSGLVIATKYTLPGNSRDPNSGGNHRKSMVCSVETSLQRLRTDYIDLLYLHAWDASTPVEEILRAMDDLVRAGKVLYVGISNTVAWQVSRMQAIAFLRGWSPLIALQVQYNLVERTVERELIPMARTMGLGVVSWGPLAGGLLSGKYSSADLHANACDGPPEGSRRHMLVTAGALSARNFAISEVVKSIAAEAGRSASQISLAWLLRNAGVTSVIMGARTVRQLQDNMGALEVSLAEEHLSRLQDASSIDMGFPHSYLEWLMNSSHMSAPMSFERTSLTNVR